MPRFVDRVVIHARAGNGGRGCASVHREKFKPLGGPDGGNGGNGGSIVFVVDPQVHTLLDFHFHPHVDAPSGKQGMGNNRDGAAGDDLELRVPDGTVVVDEDGRLLADLTGDGHPVRSRRRWSRRTRQRRAVVAGTQGARLRPARREGPGPRPHPRTQDRRRRRPGRLSVGGQVVAGVGDLGGQAEDRRLPVHHAGAQPRRGVGGGAHLHRRRRPRPDPRRVRAAVDSVWTSCATSSGARCWCTSSTAPRWNPAATRSPTSTRSRPNWPRTPRRCRATRHSATSPTGRARWCSTRSTCPTPASWPTSSATRWRSVTAGRSSRSRPSAGMACGR